MSKRAILIALVGVNLALLGALILSTYSLPAAQAQAVGRGGDYILVSARADRNHDVAYLIDLRNRSLSIIQASRQRPVVIRKVAERDLERDFRRPR